MEVPKLFAWWATVAIVLFAADVLYYRWCTRHDRKPFYPRVFSTFLRLFYILVWPIGLPFLVIAHVIFWCTDKFMKAIDWIYNG